MWASDTADEWPWSAVIWAEGLLTCQVSMTSFSWRWGLSVPSRLPSHVVEHSVVLNACLCFCNVKLHFQRSSLVKTVAVMTLCRPANVPKAVRQTVMIGMRHMSANIGLFWGDAAAAAAAAASEMDPPCYTWAHAWWLIQIASTDRINHQFTVQARWNPFRKLNLEP